MRRPGLFLRQHAVVRVILGRTEETLADTRYLKESMDDSPGVTMNPHQPPKRESTFVRIFLFTFFVAFGAGASGALFVVGPWISASMDDGPSRHNRRWLERETMDDVKARFWWGLTIGACGSAIVLYRTVRDEKLNRYSDEFRRTDDSTARLTSADTWQTR